MTESSKSKLIVSAAETPGSKWKSTELVENQLKQPSDLSSGRLLTTFVHLSDTHICDSESPARLPFTDRYADSHHPEGHLLPPPVGNYRPHEMLSAQILQSMIQTINQMGTGPVFEAEIDFLVITGDITDNAQENELKWAKQLLFGSKSMQVLSNKYFGPGGEINSEYFWNPEAATASDFPKRLFEFPTIPYFFDAVANSWDSPGSAFPVITVHGNHDALLQGTVPVDDQLQSLSVANEFPVDFKSSTSLTELIANFSPIGPTSWPAISQATTQVVPANPARSFLSAESWDLNFETESKHRVHDFAGFRLIQLDSVNPHGGWDGSFNISQIEWLEKELAENPLPTIIATHHPIATMGNTYTPIGEESRINGSEFVELLDRFPQVFMWLAGHEHRNHVEPLGTNSQILHIETCSTIDWPQEARMIEIWETESEFVVFSTMFSHAGATNVFDNAALRSDLDLSEIYTLAGIGRELALNNWQKSTGVFSPAAAAGLTASRNFEIRIRKPNWG